VVLVWITDDLGHYPAIKFIDLEPRARENKGWHWGSFEERQEQTPIEAAPNPFSDTFSELSHYS